MSASTILTAIAPQYDSVNNRDTFLSLAVQNVNSCIFGDKADQAVAYLAAHYIALSTGGSRSGGEAGPVVSKEEGDLAIKYGSVKSAPGEESLSLTHFGLTFLQLSRSVNPNIYVMGVVVEC